jgi:hypothetical protein
LAQQLAVFPSLFASCHPGSAVGHMSEQNNTPNDEEERVRNKFQGFKVSEFDVRSMPHGVSLATLKPCNLKL